MSDSGGSLPPAAVMVQHPVADFERWKAGFDEHEPARRAAGILGHHINRGEDDPNSLGIYMAVSDVDRAKEFAGSDDLKATMQAVGVTGPPSFIWMTPVREAIVWDRELPAMVVSHSVADFDRWLEGYDGAAEVRDAAGIVGHAANRSLDDPSLAVVYHQAESFDALRSFLAQPALQAAMKAAGVTSEPDVTFHTGGWAKMY
jgi:quinol monooxygenase YgiN